MVLRTKFNPFTQKPDYYNDGSEYLWLDQSTPQTVVGGIPIFDEGIQSNGRITITPGAVENIGFVLDGFTNPLTALVGSSVDGYSTIKMTSAKVMGANNFGEYTPLAGYWFINDETVLLNNQKWGSVSNFGLYFINQYSNEFGTNTGTSADGKDIGFTSYAALFYEGFNPSNTDVTFIPGAGAKYTRMAYGAYFFVTPKDTINSPTLNVEAEYVGAQFMVVPELPVASANDITVTTYGVRAQTNSGNIGSGSGTRTTMAFGGHFSTTGTPADIDIGVYGSGVTAAFVADGLIIPGYDASYDIGIDGVYRFRDMFLSGKAKIYGAIFGAGYNVAVNPQVINYLLTANDDIVVFNGTDLTASLPAATGTGKVYRIKNIDETDLTVTPDGTDTIDGESSQTLGTDDDMSIADYIVGGWTIL